MARNDIFGSIFWKKALKFKIFELQQTFLDIFRVAHNFWFNGDGFIAQKGGAAAAPWIGPCNCIALFTLGMSSDDRVCNTVNKPENIGPRSFSNIASWWQSSQRKNWKGDTAIKIYPISVIFSTFLILWYYDIVSMKIANIYLSKC